MSELLKGLCPAFASRLAAYCLPERACRHDAGMRLTESENGRAGDGSLGGRRTAAEGIGEGEMTLSDPAAIPVDDPDNPEKPKTPGVLVRAKFDCMNTSKNMAIMGGEIFDSNVPANVGQRILLVIEDNGVEGARDRLTYGIYQQPAKGWIPVDAEDPNDKGASLTWWATDAERRDDRARGAVGARAAEARRLDPGGCPLASSRRSCAMKRITFRFVLLIATAGAYGHAMASRYNLRAPAEELLLT